MGHGKRLREVGSSVKMHEESSYIFLARSTVRTARKPAGKLVVSPRFLCVGRLCCPRHVVLDAWLCFFRPLITPRHMQTLKNRINGFERLLACAQYPFVKVFRANDEVETLY